jgi:hypothetical protein
MEERFSRERHARLQRADDRREQRKFTEKCIRLWKETKTYVESQLRLERNETVEAAWEDGRLAGWQAGIVEGRQMERDEAQKRALTALKFR